ncbi:MAG: hypothetical protein RLY93_14830 [Sumerlaeia bacterium]
MTGKTSRVFKPTIAAFAALGLALSLLAASVMAQGTGDVLFREDFQSFSNGSRPSQEDWVTVGATADNYWYIADGRFDTGDADQFPFLAWAVIDAPDSRSWSEISAKADFLMLQPAGEVNLAVRWRSPANFYYASLYATTTPASPRGVEFIKVVNGIEQTLARAVHPADVSLPAFESKSNFSSPDTLEVRAVGNQFAVLVNGRTVLTATDSEFSSGQVAIGQQRNQVQFDNIVVSRTSSIGSNLPPGGGSAPPTGGNFSLLVGSGLNSSKARTLESQLVGIPVQLEETSPGTYSVFLGSYPTAAAAQSAISDYEQQGLFFPYGYEVVDRSLTRRSPSVASAGNQPAPSGAVYRVVVGESDDKSLADQLAGDLRNTSGLSNVDVAEVDGRHLVFVGEAFPNEQAAQPVVDQMQNEYGLIAVRSQRFETDPLNRGGSGAGVRVSALMNSFESALAQNNFAVAENLAYRIGREDAGADVGALIERVRQQRNKIEQGENERRERINSLKKEADIAETGGNYESAQNYYQQLARLAEEGSADYQLAQAGIDRTAALIRGRAAQGATEGGGGNFLLIAGIGAGVLLLLGIAGFVLVSRKKNAPAPVATPMMQSTKPSTPAKPAAPKPDRAAAKAAAAAAGGNAASSRKQAAPSETPGGPVPAMSSEESGNPLRTVTDNDRIRPGSIAPAATPAGSETVALPPIGAPRKPSSRAARAPQEAAASGEGNELDLKLDFLTEEPKAEPARAPSGPADESGDAVSQEFEIPPLPDLEPEAKPADPRRSSEVALPTATVHKAKADPDVFYFQDFEDESLGQAPQNWRGQYDYASLEVTNGVAAQGSSKCLRFEKKQGVGSALYSCKFPDARGRIGVEFDIRCDDKNKYLLGVYIEKDGDFRQSISTIVHRTNSNSNPTLRVQNEPVAYDFGTWKRIRYEIDLQRQIVDAFVDEQSIIIGARMPPNGPKVVNTLSIRDNLATTGILMLDNIKIFRRK